MDVSNSTHTPRNGQSPTDAVAATAAGEPPEDANNDIPDRPTAAARRAGQHESTEKYELRNDKTTAVHGVNNDSGSTAGKNEKTDSPGGRSALSDLQKADDDSMQHKGRLREKWWQVYRSKKPPPSPPDSLEEAEILPLAQINFLNELLYIWITPIIKLGKQRPLQVRLVLTETLWHSPSRTMFEMPLPTRLLTCGKWTSPVRQTF